MPQKATALRWDILLDIPATFACAHVGALSPFVGAVSLLHDGISRRSEIFPCLSGPYRAQLVKFEPCQFVSTRAVWHQNGIKTHLRA